MRLLPGYNFPLQIVGVSLLLVATVGVVGYNIAEAPSLTKKKDSASLIPQSPEDCPPT